MSGVLYHASLNKVEFSEDLRLTKHWLPMQATHHCSLSPTNTTNTLSKHHVSSNAEAKHHKSLYHMTQPLLQVYIGAMKYVEFVRAAIHI